MTRDAAVVAHMPPLTLCLSLAQQAAPLRSASQCRESNTSCIDSGVIAPANAGTYRSKTGFRVKPGMTIIVRNLWLTALTLSARMPIRRRYRRRS